MSEQHDLGATRIGPRSFRWGERTFVMGILNVTPDSFSGDGLAADDGGDPVTRAVAQARAMADEGADLLDVGGESTRPGHADVAEAEELRRTVPAVAAIRDALPDMPITIDTTKPAVAAAALDAGADAINDIWGVGADDALTRLAAERSVPIILMHNRSEPRYERLVAEVVDDLRWAIDRAVRAGVPEHDILVDPGIGFGKTAEQNLALLRELGQLRSLGHPILLGTSRKSTLGKVLDLPVDERLEATLATTALGIAAGVDVIRVHDVRQNVRAARMADAIVRGTWREEGLVSDRIVLAGMTFQARHGVHDREKVEAQRFDVDIELALDVQPAGLDDDLTRTVDYGGVYAIVRQVVESTTFNLIEALAEAIAHEVLTTNGRVDEVVVRVRKPEVRVGGPLDYAGVEIRRIRERQER